MFPLQRKIVFLCGLLLTLLTMSSQQKPEAPQQLIQKGWAALVKDNDTLAIACFESAYELASDNHQTEITASALLHLGMAYYGMSPSKGLEYATQALNTYKSLEAIDPQAALTGRSRCLQLLATIYGRLGNFRQTIRLGLEALNGIPQNDTSGYRGLIFGSLGKAYERLDNSDSAGYFYQKSLSEQLRTKNMAFLPDAYLQVATLELKKSEFVHSREMIGQALFIAENTGNQQARVSSLIGLGNWHKFKRAYDSATICYQAAERIAEKLNDRHFLLSSLESLFELKKEQQDYKTALLLKEKMKNLSDSIISYDSRKLIKNIEVQFLVSEKDKKLQLIEKEKNIAVLSNYILSGTIVFIILFIILFLLFFRRARQRDRQLLHTRDSLFKALEEQKNIRETFLQNEIEFREQQLSSLALQMMQKNELLQELLEKKQVLEDQEIKKLISSGLNQDRDWRDFNSSFERLNKNFNIRLKELYPEISQNDLKLCALIKLHLSIKEMAGILNISPDSVKTARYRLRKKLQLNTEDNLTEFIQGL